MKETNLGPNKQAEQKGTGTLDDNSVQMGPGFAVTELLQCAHKISSHTTAEAAVRHQDDFGAVSFDSALEQILVHSNLPYFIFNYGKLFVSLI